MSSNSEPEKDVSEQEHSILPAIAAKAAARGLIGLAAGMGVIISACLQGLPGLLTHKELAVLYAKAVQGGILIAILSGVTAALLWVYATPSPKSININKEKNTAVDRRIDRILEQFDKKSWVPLLFYIFVFLLILFSAIHKCYELTEDAKKIISCLPEPS